MTRVAIIGGGLAGLTCAYYLRQRQVEAIVFEPDLAGGRAAGGPYLLNPEMFLATFRLVKELGLTADVQAIAPVAGQYYRDRVHHYRVASAAGLLKFQGLHFGDKAMLAKMAFVLNRHAAELDFHHPEKGIALDDESVAGFVKRELSQNILNYVAGPLISTLFFYGSERTSKLLYLNLARHMQNTQMSTIRGGLTRISEFLTLHAEIRRERVANIEVNESYRIRGESFSHVVVAVRGNDVLNIAGLRDLLDHDDVRFFESCLYERAVQVRVDTDRPVDGQCYGVTIPRVEKLRAAAIAFHDFIDPGSVPPGSGRLSITGGGPAVTADELLEDLQRIYRIRPVSSQTAEWKSAMPMFPPGRFGEVAAFRSRKRRPGLLFCGDYLMGPFVEAAIATGRSAAEAIP